MTDGCGFPLNQGVLTLHLFRDKRYYTPNFSCVNRLESPRLQATVMHYLNRWQGLGGHVGNVSQQQQRRHGTTEILQKQTKKFALQNFFVYTIASETKRKAVMKISQFKRWLESQGVTVKNGTDHWTLRYNGKPSTLPRHPSKELKEGTKNAILKQLGLK